MYVQTLLNIMIRKSFAHSRKKVSSPHVCFDLIVIYNRIRSLFFVILKKIWASRTKLMHHCFPVFLYIKITVSLLSGM